MKRTSIKKTSTTFLIVFFILTVVGIPVIIGFINYELSYLQTRSEEISTLRADIEQIYTEFSRQAKNRKNLFLRGEDPKAFEKYSKRIKDSSEAIYLLLADLYESPLTGSYVDDLHIFEDDHKTLMQNYQGAINIFIHSNFNAVEADTYAQGRGNHVEQELMIIIEMLNAEASQVLAAEATKVRERLFGSSAIFMIIYAVLLVLLYQTLVVPITRLSSLATYMTKSRLKEQEEYEPYTLDRNDEIGDLIQSFNGFSQTIIEHSKDLEDKVKQRTTDLNLALADLETINKQMIDSIEYASLIQNNFIPSRPIFEDNFTSSMTIWEPRDIVGGDIYFLEKVGDIVYIIVIDCVGHGVSGAFVTMLVKAIKDQIFFTGEHLSCGEVLNQFHRAFNFIAQGSEQRLLDVGFDGLVLQVNKASHTVEFAGANIGLFLANQEGLQYHKGTRQSIGFKRDTIKEIESVQFDYKEGDSIIISTDGFIDQLGGENDMPFGKSRFTKILEQNLGKSMDELKANLLHDLKEYQGDHESLDDKTVLGIVL